MSGLAWLGYTTVPLALMRVTWFYLAASWGGFILMSGPSARMAGRPGSDGAACGLLHGGRRVTGPLKWQPELLASVPKDGK